MAIVEGITWKIEVGVGKPDTSRFNGFAKTETFYIFADTHNKAVEIAKKYRPDFNVDLIVKSERFGFEIIVELPDTKS